MAFSTILRRVVSSATPLAIRAMGTQINYCSALLNPLKKNTSNICQDLFRKASTPILQFSTLCKEPNSEQSLLQSIDSYIKCAEESNDGVNEIPAGFEFEFKDNLGEETVSLRREYQGEIIKVEVQMPSIYSRDDENDNGGDDSILLVVSVSKGGGTSLEFGCRAYPDEISIDNLTVKKQDAPENDNAYEGPDFLDLDENVQKAFRKYLAVRGIKLSTTKFLRQFMMGKTNREYMTWLKTVKQFTEK